MPKRLPLQPFLLVLVGVTGLALILVALRGPTEPAPGVGSTERPAAGGATAGSAVLVTASSTVRTSTVSPVPPTPTSASKPESKPTKTPTEAPTPTATPTPTPLPVRLSPPVVSPMDAVAYAEGGRLIVIQPADAEVRVVAENVVTDPETMRWSPEGRRLLYASATAGSEPGSSEGRRAVYVWDGTTGKTTELRDVPGYPSAGWEIRHAAWSPGGTRLLLSAAADAAPAGAGTWVFDLASSVIRPISNTAPSSAVWVDNETLLVRRPDQATLALTHAANPDVTMPEVLTDTLWVEDAYALSPGRDYVAFFSTKPDGASSLWVTSLPGNQPLDLTVQPAVDPMEGSLLWSADGRWIAYGAASIPPDREDGPYTLIADTTGRAETRVLQGFLPEAWSPDGWALAAYGCSDGFCRLGVVDASSGEITDLASSDELQLLDLAWSPGGAYLTYSLTGRDMAKEGLTLWNRATGEQHRLLEGAGSGPMTDVQWTGSGCAVYAARREVGSETTGRVSELWTVGPAWKEHWQFAPAGDVVASSLSERLEDRRGSRPEGLCPGPLLEEHGLVAFYGTPLGPGLGILGRYGLSETLSLLEDQIQPYREIDPAPSAEADILPAFHMVTTIADDHPGADGDFNHRVSHAVIRPWIKAVRARGGWAILDIQPGLADLALELDLIEPLLREPDVHLAVDPEFIISPGEVPGRDLGRITGPQVNYVQARMDQIARETGQRRMVVVHQFDDRMVRQKERILDYPLVDLVWDADGFGGPGPKIADYNQYKRETGFEYGGFKIFYRYDEPVMTPAQVFGLDPIPRLIIYQ